MSDFDVENGGSDRTEKHDSEKFSLNFVSNASIAKILIEKGICTMAELLAAEQKLHKQREVAETAFQPVRIKRDLPTVKIPPESKKSWLKRKMSKRRWSRKLGASLFGWEWKKVKVELPKNHHKFKREIS